jgi:hypothetical protein
MTTIKPALVIASLLLISAAPPALAFSTESGPVNSDGSSQIVDPDDQLDDMANPSSGSSGGGSMNLGAPIGDDGSISTFWGIQPGPADGLPPLPGDNPGDNGN